MFFIYLKITTKLILKDKCVIKFKFVLWCLLLLICKKSIVFFLFKVSEKYIKDMTENMFSLPGLPYTPEELFYISYAQVRIILSKIIK